MSALSNPTPVQQPPQRVTPVAPHEPPKKSGIWKGLLILGVIAAGAFSAYQYWLKPRQEAKATPAIVYRTAKVVAAPFTRSIRVSGVTSARLYANITAPRLRGFESRSQMELLRVAKNGSWVKKGEELAQIDPGQSIDHVDDIKATILQSEGDVKKRVAEQAVEWENLQQTLRVAKAQADKARYDNQAAEVRTDVERELLKLSLEEAEARYKQYTLDEPQRKLIHGAELTILGFTKERHVRHVSRHDNDLKAYGISSPMEGMAVIATVYRGGGDTQQIQQGDQLGSGQPLMKVVNPNSMQVEASVNQAESTEIRIGQTASIGFDAFPGLSIKGKVYSIGALAVGGWRQNYYIRSVPVRLLIEGSDQRLIPDLSASADVVVETKDRSTLVPIGAVSEEGGKKFVYVKQGGEFEKREVTIGSANNLYAVAVSGVKEGEELKLQ